MHSKSRKIWIMDQDFDTRAMAPHAIPTKLDEKALHMIYVTLLFVLGGATSENELGLGSQKNLEPS